jgi:hypothetical protein
MEADMTNKILISIAMTLILAIAQASVAFAQDTTPITGTVQGIVIETDSTTGETTVLVTLLDNMGTTQTVRLSAEIAASLGLVTTDPAAGETTVNDGAISTAVEIDPATVITDEVGDEEGQHPAGSALSDFFSDLLGVDYDTIMGYHEDGIGFGVIAQALWMTNRLEGDTETFQMILDAKQSKDYNAITLPDGSTPQNWGQFKKAVMGAEKKDNLGAVMSGHAEDAAGSTTPGNSNGNQHQNKEKNKDKDNKGNRHNK